MVDGAYFITVDTPIGTKYGTALLKSEGDELELSLIVKDMDTVDQVGVVNNETNTFFVEGQTKFFPFGKIEYQLEGVVEGDTLKVSCTSNFGAIQVEGERL